MPTARLLPLLVVSVVAACGGAGDASPVSGGGSGGDPGGGSTGAPPASGDFDVHLGDGGPSAAPSPPGERAAGACHWLGIAPLAQMFVDAGGAGGLARHNLRLNESNGSIGGALWNSHKKGLRTWLTVYGTPADLSPSTEGNEYSTGLPPYARWPPTDPIAWADRLVARLDPLWQNHGIRPAYLEIWNEPDRVEYWSGTREEWLDFYAAVAPYLRTQLPGVEIGGCGLAGQSSTMGGSESMLYALAERAALDALPLDFLSWHHYTIANELLDSGIVGGLRERLDVLGLGDVELVISEWNLGPNPDTWGLECDRAHAAANYAGFMTTAIHLGLDGNTFFWLQDVDDQETEIADLDGRSTGMVTRRGIKKPVFRVYELMAPMFHETQLAVTRPAAELNLQVYATREGGRTRIVVSNDWVESDWIWGTRCRERGLLPGALWDDFRAVVEYAEAQGLPLSADLLVQGGFDEDSAAAIMEFWPELRDAEDYETQPRSVSIALQGATDVRVAEVWRFDSTHNAPAEQREGILATLQATEDAAQLAAFTAAADYLTSEGWTVTATELMTAGSVEAWTQANGVPSGIEGAAVHEYNETLHAERLADQEALNALPETALASESATEAGITLDGTLLRLTLEPDSVTVLDVVDA